MYKPSLTNRPILNFQKPAITGKSFERYIASESKNVDFKNKALAISIVAYDERDLVIELVEKICSLKEYKDAGILLVDNGLDKDIKVRLKEFPIHYIEAKENLGPSLGRNLAASLCSTPIMAILDADAIIEASYITDCLEPFEAASVVCVRGKVTPLSKGSRVSPIYDLGDSTFAHYPTTEGISVWRTADFKKVGGFEKDLYSGEGVVLCYRMIEFYGYKHEQFLYYPKLRLIHDYNSSINQLASKEMRNLINAHSISLRYPQLLRMQQQFNSIAEDQLVRRSSKSGRKTTQAIDKARSAFKQDIDNLSTKTMQKRWESADKPAKDGTYQFTVILPCYNLGEYLEDAVRSVMRQTINNIQIIIVDDKSPDKDTRDILKQLEKHVTVIYRDKNGGASAARNTGVKAALSDYILCLDADDTISDTYLEEAYNMFEADAEAGVVACQVAMTGERSGTWKPKDKIGIPEALLASPIPNASCYRKGVWEKTGGYDETMRGYEDWEYWVHALSKGAKIRVLPRPHYFYYNRPDSKVKTSNKNADKIVSYIATKHKKIYEEHMVYVIANTHKMYVRERLSAIKYKENQRIDLSSRGFIIRNAYRAGRKTKTALRVALREKDRDELMRLGQLNVNKLSEKLRR